MLLGFSHIGIDFVPHREVEWFVVVAASCFAAEALDGLSAHPACVGGCGGGVGAPGRLALVDVVEEGLPCEVFLEFGPGLDDGYAFLDLGIPCGSITEEAAQVVGMPGDSPAVGTNVAFMEEGAQFRCPSAASDAAPAAVVKAAPAAAARPAAAPAALLCWRPAAARREVTGPSPPPDFYCTQEGRSR